MKISIKNYFNCNILAYFNYICRCKSQWLWPLYILISLVRNSIVPSASVTRLGDLLSFWLLLVALVLKYLASIGWCRNNFCPKLVDLMEWPFFDDFWFILQKLTFILESFELMKSVLVLLELITFVQVLLELMTFVLVPLELMIFVLVSLEQIT